MTSSRKWGVYALIIACCFLFLEYMLRLSSSVIVPELSHALNVEAAGIGVLASSYYFVYLAMQIPAGIILDKIGIKKSLIFSIVLLGLGSLLMGNSHSLMIAVVARILMAIGSAFAYVGALKILCDYIKPKNKSLWIGVIMTLATVGAVCGQEPWYVFTKFLENWRSPYFIFGVVSLILALVACLLPKISPPHQHKQYNDSAWHSIKQKSRDKSLWAILLYVGTLSTQIIAFTAFWAVPFFHQALSLSRDTAASLASLSWVGGLFGGPLMGFIADYFRIRKQTLIFAGLVASLIVLLILFAKLPVAIMGVLLFILGILCNSNVIVFSLVTELAPENHMGLFLGITNVFNGLVSPILQLLIGLFLSIHVSTMGTDGAPIYSYSAYQSSLVIVPILLVITSLVLAKVMPKAQAK